RRERRPAGETARQISGPVLPALDGVPMEPMQPDAKAAAMFAFAHGGRSAVPTRISLPAAVGFTDRHDEWDYLSPLAGRGRRALARGVRGRVRESEPKNGPILSLNNVERPPHPDPLPASGAREKRGCGTHQGYVIAKSAGVFAAVLLAAATLLRP